jgi:hypothetical protein
MQILTVSGVSASFDDLETGIMRAETLRRRTSMLRVQAVDYI